MSSFVASWLRLSTLFASRPAPQSPAYHLCIQWSSSVRLERTPSGFEGPIRIPFGEKIQYKFIVDGRWLTDDAAPTEADNGGFINNVYTAPERPVTVTSQEPAPEPEPEPTGSASVVAAAQDFAEQTLPAHDAPTPEADKPADPLVEESKEAASPIPEAASEAPAVEPTKTMFDYAKGIAASFLPTLSPKGSRSTSPVPGAAPTTAKASESPSNGSIPFVPVAAPLEDSAPTVVSGSSTADSGGAQQASTHIPLPPPGKTEPSTSPDVNEAAAPVPAPPVMAAEPVSSGADAPKEVVEAAPVAAVETAAAPSSVIETKNDEVAASEEKTTAPEVLAAPPPEAEPKEVVPVISEEPKPVNEVAPEAPASTEPTQDSAVEPAKDSTIEPTTDSAVEPVKDTAAEPAKESATEQTTTKEETAKEETATATTPKKDSPQAPSTPSNGHSRFGTLRNGSVRKFSFPHRRASSQGVPEAEGADKSPVSSVKGSTRKKRTSFIGKIKDVFHHGKPIAESSK